MQLRCTIVPILLARFCATPPDDALLFTNLVGEMVALPALATGIGWLASAEAGWGY